MGNSGAVLCLAVPLLAMILALYALLYDRHEIGRMLGGPWRRYRYQRYLRSERWRLLRKQVLRRAGWRCDCALCATKIFRHVRDVPRQYISMRAPAGREPATCAAAICTQLSCPVPASSWL